MSALAYLLGAALLAYGALYGAGVSDELRGGVLTLVGVLIGVGLTGLVSFVQARVTARSQVAATTWTKRLEVHQTAFQLLDELAEYDSDAIKDALAWWKRHCLYMSSDAMDTLHRALITYAHISRRSLEELEDESRKYGISWSEHARQAKKDALKAIIKGAGRHVTDKLIQDLGKEKEARYITG